MRQAPSRACSNRGMLSCHSAGISSLLRVWMVAAVCTLTANCLVPQSPVHANNTDANLTNDACQLNGTDLRYYCVRTTMNVHNEIESTEGKYCPGQCELTSLG